MIDINTARRLTEQAKENQLKSKTDKHLKEIEDEIKKAAMEGKNHVYYKKCANEDEMSTIIFILNDLSYKAEECSIFGIKWVIEISW